MFRSNAVKLSREGRQYMWCVYVEGQWGQSEVLFEGLPDPSLDGRYRFALDVSGYYPLTAAIH